MNYTNLDPLLNNVLVIKSQGKSYDLHSDSDFYGLIYCKSQANVKLIWNYPSKWFRNESIFKNDRTYLETHNIKKYDHKIELSFEEVGIFEVSSSITEISNNNQDILEDIRNYYENDGGEIEEDGSVIFVFQSEMQIRIKCNSISFQTK